MPVAVVLRVGASANSKVRMYGFCAKPRDGIGGVVAMVINLQNTRQEVTPAVDRKSINRGCGKRYAKYEMVHI
jgi:hypothetical protein